MRHGEGPTRVTWLVAGWHVAAELGSFLAAYQKLTDTADELVLAVGGTDGSLAAARAFQQAHPEVGLKVVEQVPSMGKQGALAAAWPQVTGDIIYLTDMDCRPTDSVARPLLAWIQRGCDAVTGPIRPLPAQETMPLVRVQWAVLRARDRGGASPSRGLTGANTAITRAMIERVGAFDWDAPTGTDYTLAKLVLAAGGSIWREPASEMPARFPERGGHYVAKQARWLGTVWRHGWRYGAWDEVRAVSCTLAMPWVALLLLAAGWWWPGAWGGLLLLVAEALRRRAHYTDWAGVPVGTATLIASVLVDFLAALEATRRVAVRRGQWT